MSSRSNPNPNTLFDILGKDGARPSPRVETPSPATAVGIVIALGLILILGGAWWFTRGETPQNPTPDANNRTQQPPLVSPAVYAVEVTAKAWVNSEDLKDVQNAVTEVARALLAHPDFKKTDPRCVPDLERRLYRVLVGRAPTRADPELMKLEERVKKFIWKGRRAFEESARRIETGEK